MRPTLGTESMENKLACQHVLCFDNWTCCCPLTLWSVNGGEISPSQCGPLRVIGRLGGEGEKKACREVSGKRKAISLLPPSTVCLLFFCYSIFNGIPSESPGLSWGAGRDFPQLPWTWPPATFIRKNYTRKIELKETPSCLISRLLVVFTRQLEILVTVLERLFRGESKVRETWKSNL